jgi:YebC/PmpR family DNA-binding regulatory protein
MSGHSKWSQIKRQKGVADVKRGATFSKLANAISIAARGGADPNMNFQLRIAIEKARAANMPKDNIQRAIDKVSGSSGGPALEEILFEAYGPNGIAFLIETATDNRNRTSSQVREVLTKAGGKLAETGSVSYLFAKKGLIVLPTNDKAEEIELAAIDAGADDVSTSDDHVFVYTKPQELMTIVQKLADQDYQAEEFNLVWEPTNHIEITDQTTAEKLIKLSENLEDLDDVVKVASNFDISPDILSV